MKYIVSGVIAFVLFISVSNAQTAAKVKAAKLYEHGKYKKALRLYDSLLNANSNDTDSFYGRGLVKMALNDFDGATKDFVKVLKLNQKDADAYLNMGIAESKKGTPDNIAALNDINHSITLRPDFSDSYNYRGNVEYSMGDTLDARTDYTKSIQLDSTNQDAFFNRGYMEIYTGKYEAAFDDLTFTIALDNRDASAFFYRALSLDEMKKYRDAALDYNRAIEIDPKYAEAYLNRGLDKYQLAFYQLGADDFTEVVKLDSDNAVAYYCRALCEDRLKKYQAAIDDYTSAMRFQDSYAEAFYGRGNVYMEEGDKERACSDFNDSYESGYAPAKINIDNYCKNASSKKDKGSKPKHWFFN